MPANPRELFRLACPGHASHQAKASPVIKTASSGVLARYEQLHAAAPVYASQVVHNGLHCQAAVAAVLLTDIQGEPAKPPARLITLIRMDDVEAHQRARDFDGK